MHLDEEAANKSMLKGLSGSGWHTCAIMMRMIYDGFLHESSSLGAPGVDEVRWIRPVRPGDELTIRITASRSATPEAARKSAWCGSTSKC